MRTVSRLCAGWQIGLCAAFIASVYYAAPSVGTVMIAIICVIASGASAVCLWRARAFIALLALTSITYAAEVKIPACASHDEMAAALLSVAKESPIGIGITQDRSVLEVYASESGTWTAVQTDVSTRESCIKSYGTNWQTLRIPPKEQKVLE